MCVLSLYLHVAEYALHNPHSLPFIARILRTMFSAYMNIRAYILQMSLYARYENFHYSVLHIVLFIFYIVYSKR